jgi:hypothetical protein
MLRLGPGGRALAALREPWGNNLAVAFLAGRGGALRELLMALRYEADADGSTTSRSPCRATTRRR